MGSKQIEHLRGLGIEETATLFGCDVTSGLTQAEAGNRLKINGSNEILEKKTNRLFLFLKKFWGLTAWMLELIIVLSWFLHKEFDSYIVAGLLVFNAIIGFVQEQNAARAVDTLKNQLHVNTKVLRDGTWRIIPARELVPGDIIRVRIGDFVPADVKIFQGDIRVDQSALTGESIEARKGSTEIIFSGSIITHGEASGIVILTGASTYFGRTIQLVQIARPKLHAETMIAAVIKRLLLIVALLVVIALFFSLWRGMNPLELLPLTLVLLLGAVPVALPAMFTVSMALGSRELTKQGVLVTRLNAPDDAARMDILCVDKTGTLTLNQMSVADLIPLNGFTQDEILLFGALASQEANHDAIDMALIKAARQKGLLNDHFVQKSFTPFDPKTRKTEAVIKNGNQEFRILKGSFKTITQICRLEDRAITDLKTKADALAMKGYKTLAVAKALTDGKLALVGLVALHDPPRSDSQKMINELNSLGVSVRMLTGDALPIATEIARTVGIGERIIKASEFNELARTDPEKAAELVENNDGFADVYPEDKYLIVKNLQARGHIVGMTGDGVNDAPALKQAEVGTAVSRASDVAKGAASIVLTGEGLSGIISPIIIGRKTFRRINTWILNKVARTVLKTCFVVFPYLFLGKYVINASAMLVMIFMTDFVKISLSTDNVRWSKKPETWDIDRSIRVAVVIGLVMVAEAFGLLALGLNYFHLAASNEALNTFSFEILLFFAMFSIFVVREKGHFWNSTPSKTMLLVISADLLLGISLATFGLLGFKAIPLFQTITVIGYTSLCSFVINDLIKFNFLKKWDRQTLSVPAVLQPPLV